ncbi:MAG: nucleoside-diphosphate sugar epimerase [Gammaproteobacteria bacterium]
MSPSATPSRKVLLAGASGLIGGLLLRGLLANETVFKVYAPVRRSLEVSHPKLHTLSVDFNALPAFPPLDEAYLALGTTIQVAGSRQAFRAVDFEASLAAARVAVQAGARRIGLVSAAGANARSAVFYNRVKGELEDALRQLNLEGLVIARPSLLLDSRSHLGQPPRMAESLAIPIARLIAPLTPRTYRPIHGAEVARALLRTVPTAKGVQILSSGDMGAP